MLKLVTVLALLILPTAQAAQIDKIIKSPNDKRSYQSFSLENEMQVLVISDPEADKAAVSLDIDVGSADNPASRPGLAHFLEHMLFLGTEKYPEAGEYQAFIQSHSGSHNAFTALENTNYYFDIAAESLEPALDRFAQFFISPLFSEKYTNRERNAVHSEYQAKLKDDGRRNFAAFKQILNPEHPGSRFAVGSLETLADNENGSVRADLLAFYQHYYSANRMTLVVLGKAPLDTLKQLVTEKFSAVENRRVSKPTIEVKRLPPNALPMQLATQSIKDIRQLSLSFPMPPAKQYWRDKPMYYISSLIGYEGEGSLLALLKREGLANALSAGYSNDSDLESSFQVGVSLTPLGLENVDRVTEYFFDFIVQLKQQGVSERIFREEKQLSAQAFQFLPRQAPSSYVVWLSQAMRDYPKANWLNAPYLLEHYKPQLIEQYLGHITPDNMLMNVQAKNISAHQRAPHYDTPYTVSKFTEQQLARWRAPRHDPALAVRAANPFVADNVSLVEASDESVTSPTEYTLSKGVRLWHMQDSEFKTPKSDLFFTLLMPAAKLDTKERLTLSLYSQLLNDKLNKTLYDARAAGIGISLYSHSRGLSVRISGYSDKQPRVIEALENLAQLRFTPERFAIVKEDYRKNLANSLKDKPYNQLISELYQILGDTADTRAKLEALASISLDDIYQMAKQYAARGELRVLSHGNIDLANAQALALKVQSTLAPAQQERVERLKSFLELPAGTELQITRAPDQNDSAQLLYLQGPSSTHLNRAATAVLSEMLSSDYYTQLRTEQQLGYIVFASNLSVRRHPGVIFVVQSPSATPQQIAASNKAFLTHFSKKLNTLSAAQLDKYKHSVSNRLSEKERTIKQRSERLWREIDLGKGRFDDRNALLASVNALSTEDLNSVWQQMLTRQISLSSLSDKLNQTEPSSQNQAAYDTIAEIRSRGADTQVIQAVVD
ncbi:MAG: insulinase family protein [Pseudomonadales bacterium]